MNEFITKLANSWQITEAGKKKLDQVITNPKGEVYAFNDSESPVLIAAAMARLSRRGDDMRITYLDEFAGKNEQADALIGRVVTAYGDDSVQQLVGIHLVVENASNLLTKLLEWGRLGAYLEQSTRYIFFDKLDESGKYKFYTPTDLAALTIEYDQTLTQIFELYSRIVRGVTAYVRNQHAEPTDKSEKVAWQGATRAQACDAARPVLPVATKATVGLFLSAQALESLIIHLESDPLPEAQAIGKQILDESRKVLPAFLERTDVPERGGAAVAYRATGRSNLRKLADKYIKDDHLIPIDAVTLVSYWPKNEYDLIPEILFESSNAPLESIYEQVSKLTAEQKSEILATAIGERLNRRHKPGRSFEIPHYEFQITGDYGTFRDLQRHRIVDGFEWQRLTPDIGYDIPDLIKAAGFEKDFIEAFNLSENLYKTMQAKGFSAEAQYATLLGHKMRYRFMLNARASFHFLELRTSPQGHPGYRKICQHMFNKIAEVHPNIASSMKFINEGEDPGLTRLAAERATQFKLEQLDNKAN
ncbi:MAG: FAD-dependent thymidylate synthase [Candidatus Saccharimonadia bacterium]